MLSSACSSRIDTYATESAKTEVRLMIVPGKKGYVVNRFNTSGLANQLSKFEDWQINQVLPFNISNYVQ
jgi:hypothetical protein